MIVVPATHDSAGIQAAYDTPGAHRIELDPVVYDLDGPELTGNANISLVGVKGQSILRRSVPPAPGTDSFFFNGKSNIAFHGVTFDGNAMLGAGAGRHPAALPTLHLSGCNGIEITECDFLGFYNSGVFANIAHDVRITRNRVNRGSATTHASSGIGISGSAGAGISNRIWIEENLVEFCNISTLSSDTFIRGNDISKWGFSAGINTQAIAGSARNVITGNHVHDSNWAADDSPYDIGGIENWALDSVVANNIVHGCFGNGMDIGGSNNAVTGNLSYGNRNSGVFLLRQDPSQNACGTYVGSNKLYGNGRYGVEEQLGSGLSNVEIGDNGTRSNVMGDYKLFSATRI